MRLAALLTPIFALSLMAQGRISVDKPQVNLGQVDASGGPVPFAFTVTNKGNEDLKLQWLDFGDPAILAEITNGLLKPGQSTQIRGALDARHLAGRFSSRIEVHAEDIQAPITPLEVTAIVAPDVIMTSGASAAFDQLKWNDTRAGKAFSFKTRSGDAIDPSTVKVLTTAPYLSFATEVDKDSLKVIPTLSEAKLPMVSTGHVQALVQVDVVEYAIDFTWTREAPLGLALETDGSFVVKSTDGRPFKLGKVLSEPKLTFRTKKVDGGYSITPVQPKKKPLALRKVTVTTNHPLKPTISWLAPASK